MQFLVFLENNENDLEVHDRHFNLHDRLRQLEESIERLESREEESERLLQESEKEDWDKLSCRPGDELDESSFNQDTFSFMITSKPWSLPFLTSLMVFFLKSAIFYLVLANLVNWGANFNKLGIPVSVSATVVVSQFFAFGISVFTQDDLITSMLLVYEGFHDIKRSLPNVTRLQWSSAVVLSAVDALLGLLATFVLIIDSATVLDVLLNFAAVEFVSQLDNIAFELAKSGFLGQHNQIEAEELEELTYKVRRKAKTPGFIRGLGMCVVLVVILSLWLTIYVNQILGNYAVKSVIIQFDDSIRPEVGPHCGSYHLNTAMRVAPGATRFFYYEDRSTGGGQFALCRSTKRWAFLINGGDPCKLGDVVAQSATDITFQLTDSAANTWYVLEGSQHRLELPQYTIAEGCLQHQDCGVASQGRCVRNNCVCSSDYTGYHCNFRKDEICGTVQIDGLTGTSFASQRPVSSSYELVKGIEAYHRAVYLNNITGDLMVFTGLRWIITNTGDRGLHKFGSNVSAVLEYIGSSEFHASVVQNVDMMSDQVWLRSTNDVAMSPVGLQWYPNIGGGDMANANLGPNPDAAILLCATCNNTTNPCSPGSVCNVDGKCECLNGQSGALCQIPPTGDGKCDELYNDKAYDYDGGDCCRATCHSSPKYRCGALPDRSSVVRIGYPHCNDPSVVGLNTTNPFIPRTSPITPFSSSNVTPALSANGRILVLGEPAFDSVRVFEQATNKWVQRGVTFKGVVGSRFGQSVAIATLPGMITSVRHSIRPAFVAVSSGGGVPMVHGFDWTQSSSRWLTLPRIELHAYGLCLSAQPCLFSVRAGVTSYADLSRQYVVVVSIDEGGLGKTNTLFTCIKNQTVISEWSSSPLQSSDLVTVTTDGDHMMFFNESSTAFTLLDVPINRSFDSDFLLPDELSTRTDVSIKVEAVQSSGDSHHFSCIFRAFFMNETRSYIHHYRTGLHNGRTPRKVAEMRIDFPFSAASFSSEGDSFAAVLTESVRSRSDSRDIFHVIVFNQATRSFQRKGHIVTSDVQKGQSTPTKVSVSFTGGAVTFGGKKKTETFGLRSQCTASETKFRVSLQADVNPEAVLWDLANIRKIHGSVVTSRSLLNCHYCYSKLDFVRTDMVEQRCIPLRESNCLRFNFTDVHPPFQANSGYEAFMIVPNGTDLSNVTVNVLAVGKEQDASQTVLVGLDDPRCDATPPSLIIIITHGFST